MTSLRQPRTPDRGRGRVRRRLTELVPAVSDSDAQCAADRIRRLRSTAHDPDLDYYPRTVVDEDDVTTVVHYLHQHRRVPDEVRRAELPDRALLVRYLRQQADQALQRHELAVLDTGHEVHALPSLFGRWLGLWSRQAVWNRRKLLTTRWRRGGEHPPTAAETEHAGRVDRWLVEHHPQLLRVAEVLVDHREHLAALVDDEQQRRLLIEAIDGAGEAMTSRPTRTSAGTVAYAMFLLREDGPAASSPDPIVREAVAIGTRLRAGFNTLTDTSGTRG